MDNIKTFDEILESILKSVEENPSMNIDEVISSKMNELGLTSEGQNLLNETNKFLEAYNDAYARFMAAKKEGVARNAWVQGELLKIADKNGLSDEQKEQLISDIADACENELNKTITEED